MAGSTLYNGWKGTMQKGLVLIIDKVCRLSCMNIYDKIIISKSKGSENNA